MKRIIAFLSISLCLLLVLCSCGTTGAMFNKDKLNNPEVSDAYTAKQLSALTGYEIQSSSGDMVYATKTTVSETIPVTTTVVHLVYNLKTETTVVERTSSVSIESTTPTTYAVQFTKGHAVLTTLTDGESTYSVYAPDGTTVCQNIKEMPTFVNDCITWDDQVYRYNKYTYAKVDTYTRSTLLGKIPECLSDYTEKYYYKYNSSEDILTIFDNHYTPISEYHFHDWAEDYDYYIFSDGYVLVQYLELLPDDAEKYELLTEGKKYDIHHELINPKNGKIKSLDLDYLISDHQICPKDTGMDEYDMYADSIKDIVTIQKIENKRLADLEETYAAESNGKLGICISSYEGFQAGYWPLGNGYVVVLTRNTCYLLNSKMKPVGEIGMSAIGDTTANYIVTEDGIYDYTLKRLVNLKEDQYKNYSIEDTVGNALLFTETLEEPIVNEDSTVITEYYYLYVDNAFRKIGTNLNFDDSNKFCYSLEDTATGDITVYDAKGNSLFTGCSSVRVVNNDKNACVLAIQNDNDGTVETVYYKLTMR